MGFPGLEFLVFGPKQPSFSFRTESTGLSYLEVKDAYSLDLSERARTYRERPQGDDYPGVDSLDWWYFWSNTTTPNGMRLNLKRNLQVRPADMTAEQKREAWNSMISEVRSLCRSPAEMTFFDKFTAQQRSYRDKNPDALWKGEALIPQVWLNVIQQQPRDNSEAEERGRTPFIVDFVILRGVSDGQRAIVVEIDGHQHYQTPADATKTLAKSRFLQRAGWRHFRFHAAEVESLSPDALIRDLTFDDEIPF